MNIFPPHNTLYHGESHVALIMMLPSLLRKQSQNHCRSSFRHIETRDFSRPCRGKRLADWQSSRLALYWCPQSRPDLAPCEASEIHDAVTRIFGTSLVVALVDILKAALLSRLWTRTYHADGIYVSCCASPGLSQADYCALNAG